jgi:hypothetical protein
MFFSFLYFRVAFFAEQIRVSVGWMTLARCFFGEFGVFWFFMGITSNEAWSKIFQAASYRQWNEITAKILYAKSGGVGAPSMQ